MLIVGLTATLPKTASTATLITGVTLPVSPMLCHAFWMQADSDLSNQRSIRYFLKQKGYHHLTFVIRFHALSFFMSCTYLPDLAPAYGTLFCMRMFYMDLSDTVSQCYVLFCSVLLNSARRLAARHAMTGTGSNQYSAGLTGTGMAMPMRTGTGLFCSSVWGDIATGPRILRCAALCVSAASGWGLRWLEG